MSSNTLAREYDALTGTRFLDDNGRVIVGDIFKDGVLYRCHGQLGMLHCESSYALQDGTHIEYYLHGKRHRSRKDGPAVLSLQDDYVEYWENGVRVG